MCTKNYNHMRYGSWDTKLERIFCHFGSCFAFLTPSPPNKLENQNFKKMKKISGDVIILNLCKKKTTKKTDQMMYAYSDMECLHRNNFLSFQVSFCFFAPLMTPKIKICKKCQKPPEHIILLHMCTINQDHKCVVPEIWSSTDRIFWSSGAIFCPFTPLTPWKMKISKMKKNPGDIIILHKCTKNHDHLL